MAAIFGWIAAASSILITLFGMPKQAMQNRKRQSCKGLSFSLVFTTAFAYTAWTAYGFVSRDAFLFWSQLPGTALASFIALQFWIYRKSKN